MKGKALLLSLALLIGCAKTQKAYAAPNGGQKNIGESWDDEIMNFTVVCMRPIEVKK